MKLASHHIPSGRHKLDHTEALPADIVDMMSARDDLRSRDPTSPALSQMNDEINQVKNRHKRDKWRTFVETLDHKSASSKLWRTIKTLDGKSTQTDENEAITFNGSQVSSPKQIANCFNEQFTTSKLGRHNSSRETRLVSRKVRRNPKETTVTFTTDLVTRAIRSCNNRKACVLDTVVISGDEVCWNAVFGTLVGVSHRGAKQGGVSTPPEFWMGGLNTCQPPLILGRFFLGGVGSPQIDLTI